MEGFGRYAAPIFMGASLLYALGQKHRREMKKEQQEGAHNRCVDRERGREGVEGGVVRGAMRKR
jgi:hypothetical protein